MKVTIQIARKRAAEEGVLDESDFSLVDGLRLAEAMEDWGLRREGDEVEDVSLTLWQRLLTPGEGERRLEELARIGREEEARRRGA